MTKLPITQVATSDLAQLLSPQAGRRMELPGFSEEFVDFPDYIIRITDRIWHERKIELCREYYTEDCVIHTMNGDICGAATVIENTHATLNAFPDRRLDADNVIWSDEGEGKFYSSHLITSKMTNLGPSEFGPPTGKKSECAPSPIAFVRIIGFSRNGWCAIMQAWCCSWVSTLTRLQKNWQSRI